MVISLAVKAQSTSVSHGQTNGLTGKIVIAIPSYT